MLAKDLERSVDDFLSRVNVMLPPLAPPDKAKELENLLDKVTNVSPWAYPTGVAGMFKRVKKPAKP
jgi:hypothetical protein